MTVATLEEAHPYQVHVDVRAKHAARGLMLHRRIPRQLPQELIDQVVDCLADDSEALKACSLVCHAWIHRCRQHLHRSVTIYHQNCCIHHSQVQKALRLLASPMVSAYTQELHLEGKNEYGTPHKASDEQDDNVDGVDLFWRVLALFQNVHTLEVNRLLWVAHSVENKDRLCTSFPNVKVLDVYMSEFVDFDEFLSFLTAFPKLIRLKMERVFWDDNAEEWYIVSGIDPSTYRALPQDATPGKELNHVEVQHCDVPNMLDISRWLSVGSPTVTSLSLSPPDGDDFAALPSYFRALGPSLEKLFLTLEFATKDETLRQAICDLELCSRLRSLTLAANFGLGRKFVKAANIFWPCVLIVLSHVASACLQTIRFECQTEDLESAALLQLDAMLCRPAFTQLVSVRFALGDRPTADMQHTLDTLRGLLPYTSSRYRLVVS